MAWTSGLVIEFRLLHTVVVGSISSGGDHVVHCWCDLIRSKQLFSAPYVTCRCVPDFLVMLISNFICIYTCVCLYIYIYICVCVWWTVMSTSTDEGPVKHLNSLTTCTDCSFVVKRDLVELATVFGSDDNSKMVHEWVTDSYEQNSADFEFKVFPSSRSVASPRLEGQAWYTHIHSLSQRHTHTHIIYIYIYNYCESLKWTEDILNLQHSSAVL